MYRDKDAAFIAHPKTASIAVAEMLGWIETSPHHEIEDTLPPNVISVIREPRDWYVSWYFYLNGHWEGRNKPRPPFQDWLPRFIESNEYGFHGLKHTTHLVFYDRLQEGMNAALADLGRESRCIPRVNTTRGRDGATADDIFDDATSRLVDTEHYDSLIARLCVWPYLRLR